MFFGISGKTRRRTRKNFSNLLKNHCGMSEYSINDLTDMIDREEAIYYGLAKFEKIEKDGKEFYACDLLGRDLFGREYLFERQTIAWCGKKAGCARVAITGISPMSAKTDNGWFLRLIIRFRGDRNDKRFRGEAKNGARGDYNATA